MASPKFDPERAARALADAVLSGDASAADKHEISLRTLYRWRARVEKNPELSAVVREKKRQLAEDANREWRSDAVLTMRATLARIREVLPQCGPEHLRDLNGTAKILGDLDIAREVLTDGDDERAEDDRTGPGAATSQGQAPGAAPRSPAVH